MSCFPSFQKMWMSWTRSCAQIFVFDSYLSWNLSSLIFFLILLWTHITFYLHTFIWQMQWLHERVLWFKPTASWFHWMNLSSRERIHTHLLIASLTTFTSLSYSLSLHKEKTGKFGNLFNFLSYWTSYMPPIILVAFVRTYSSSLNPFDS